MARHGGRTWQTVRPKVDLSRMPLRIDLSPQRGRMIVLILAGLVWAGIPYWIFSDALTQSETAGGPPVFFWFVVLFSALSLLVVAQGTLGLLRRRAATIDRSFVTLSGSGLLSRENWREPLQNYAGILHREGRISRKNHSATYQIVELVHPDPQKTVLLDVIRGNTPPQGRCEAFARALNLPLLDEAGESRAVADLDKSLRQQVQEGAVATTYDPGAPVPQGLMLERRKSGGEDAILITMQVPRIPRWMMLLFIAVPLLVAGLSTLQNGLTAGIVVVLLIIGAAVWFRQQDREHPRVLEITHSEVILHDKFNRIGGPGTRAALRHDEIEQIYVSTSRGHVLAIAGDRLTLTTGGGLSQAALEWLKAYLTAAIANA